MKNEFIRIDNNHLDLLDAFINKLGSSSKSFRYFNHRDFNCLVNHLATFMILEKNNPVCYGHLDKEGDYVWLGIAVIEEKVGTGLGKCMMKLLLSEAKKQLIKEIYLTVDIDNMNAVSLYKKYGFNIVKKTDKYYKMNLILT